MAGTAEVSGEINGRVSTGGVATGGTVARLGLLIRIIRA